MDFFFGRDVAYHLVNDGHIACAPDIGYPIASMWLDRALHAPIRESEPRIPLNERGSIQRASTQRAGINEAATQGATTQRPASAEYHLRDSPLYATQRHQEYEDLLDWIELNA